MNFAVAKKLLNRSNHLVLVTAATALGLTACGPAAQPAPPSASIPIGSNGPSLSAAGLQAEYFSRPDLSGPSVHQTDSVLNFNWGRLPAARGVKPGHLSARWTGQLVAAVTGRYTLHLEAADGQAQLSLKGQLVKLSEGAAVVQLEAGKGQPLNVVFTQTGSEPKLRLEWESADAGIKREVVPVHRFARASASFRPQNVATGGAPRGQNLLTNGDFEGGSAAWLGSYTVITPGYGGSGQAAGLSNFGYLQQNLPAQMVEVGASYTLTAFAKSSTSAACSVGLAYSDSNGNTTKREVPFSAAWGGNWQGGTLTLNLPYGSTFMAVYLGGNAGSCSFDNLSLTVPATGVPAQAASNWVVNGDFETGTVGSAPSPWGAGTLVSPGRSGGQGWSNAHWSWTQQNIAASTVTSFTTGQAYTLAASARAVNGGACSVLFQGGDDSTVLFSTVLDFRSSTWTSSSIAGTLPAGLRWTAVILATTDPECQFDDVSVGSPSPSPTVAPAVTTSSPVSSIGGSSQFSVDGANAQSVTWTFSDGGTATGADVSHTFAAPGLYTATASLTYPDGRRLQSQQQVAVLKAMKDIPASRSLSDTMTVQFDAGDPLPGFTYSLNYGDGTVADGSRTSHTYSKIGTYNVELVVRDTRASVQGQSVHALNVGTDTTAFRDKTWVTVWRKAPIATFTLSTPKGAGIPVGTVPFTASFDASASHDDNVGLRTLTYAWDFGDGTTGTGAQVSHAYTTVGMRLVTLTVTNQYGLSDVYRTFVHARDIRTNLILNAEYPTVTAASAQSFGAAEDDFPANVRTRATRSSGVVRAQATGDTITQYFPYVLRSDNNVTGAVHRPMTTDGRATITYCDSYRAYVNGAERYPAYGYPDPNDPTFCNSMVLQAGTIGRLPAQNLNELLITTSQYLNAIDFNVLDGLRVPKVYVAVVPDNFLPGDKASPFVTENTAVAALTGKTEYMLTVRIRQSEMLNGTLKFKVPVWAVDANGKFLPTMNGIFNARFDNIPSDCGDCTMVNGKAYLNVTVNAVQFATGGQQLDLTHVTMYGGNTSCGRDTSSPMATIVKERLAGCSNVVATFDVPTANAPAVNPFPYPVSTTFFGHIVYGETAEKVEQWRNYMTTGVYEDYQDFVLSFIPFLGSGKDFMSAASAYRAKGGNPTFLILAGAGVVADVAPVLGKAFAPVLKSYEASRLRTGGLAKGLDEVVQPSIDARRDFQGISSDLDSAFGTGVQALESCGQVCLNEADAVLKKLQDKGLGGKPSLNELELALKDAQSKNIATNDRLNDVDIFGVCSSSVGSASVSKLSTRISIASIADWCVNRARLRSNYGSYFSSSTRNYDDSIGHVLTGNIKSGGYTGGHLESELPAGAVVTNPVSHPTNPGVYQGTITFTNSSGQRFTKNKSTFFPKTWTPDKTLSEIVSALQEARSRTGGVSGNYFKGVSASGLLIEGRLDAAGLITNANPVF